MIVGTDGSEQSLDAVGWASDNARARAALLKVLVVGTSKRTKGPVDGPRRQMSREEFQAHRKLEQAGEAAAKHARAVAPEVDVDVLIEYGDPVEVLTRSAATDLLVVGARGLGPVTGVVAGSVSRRVIGRSEGPVVVVGSSPKRRGRVVAGVDGGASTEAVLAFAFEEAKLRDAELLVVHALGADDASLPEPVTASIDRLSKLHQSVPATVENANATATEVLLDRSSEADLVVVGTRGRGPATGLFLGSVGQALVARGGCPIAVVPDTRS